MKHLLYEHQNNITTLKADGELALKLQQDEFRKREGDLGKDKRNLKLELKEQVRIPTNRSYQPTQPTNQPVPTAGLLMTKQFPFRTQTHVCPASAPWEVAARESTAAGQPHTSSRTRPRCSTATSLRWVGHCRLAAAPLHPRTSFFPSPPQELAHQDIIRQLKLEQAKEVTKLRQEFELQARELQQKYEKKMKMLRDDLELRRKQVGEGWGA